MLSVMHFVNQAVVFCFPVYPGFVADTVSVLSPPASCRQHLSCDVCLKDESENYQNCSVLYCVRNHYLLLAKREAEVAGRLRSTKKYPIVRACISRNKNSFIPYALFNFQRNFHVCMFVIYVLCMCLYSLVLIQPLGCQNPINVMFI